MLAFSLADFVWGRPFLLWSGLGLSFDEGFCGESYGLAACVSGFPSGFDEFVYGELHGLHVAFPSSSTVNSTCEPEFDVGRVHFFGDCFGNFRDGYFVVGAKVVTSTLSVLFENVSVRCINAFTQSVM